MGEGEKAGWGFSFASGWGSRRWYLGSTLVLNEYTVFVFVGAMDKSTCEADICRGGLGFKLGLG